MFLGQSKSTLCLPKVDAFRNQDYFHQNSNAFYGQQFREPRRGVNSDLGDLRVVYVCVFACV